MRKNIYCSGWGAISELSPLRPYLCFKKNDTITLKKQIQITGLEKT
nr:hypothetical protein [Leptospira borgpetersenii]